MERSTKPIKKRKLLHWLGGLALLGLGAVVLAWGITLLIASPGDRSAKLSVPITPELIARGAYLARAGDCVACHSKPGGEMFAGGLPIQSPIGGMVPPNITPDPTSGIGNFTYGDFVRAVRYGVNQQGNTLYPAMPWPSYAKIADSDMEALYAYFMTGVKPVSQASTANSIPWPLSLRWPVTYWRWFFGPEVKPPSTPPTTPLELGAYYVEGLGHCGACHTPRALTMQEKALDNHAGSDYLAGGQVIDGYATPSLRLEEASGIKRLSPDEIVELLQTGRTDKYATFGGMSQVVTDSTQYMTTADLHAMALYLRSLSPNRQEKPLYYDSSTFETLAQGPASSSGAKLYQENCAGCHVNNGLGYRQTFPSLALNPVVNDPNPQGLIRLVLSGGSLAKTQHKPHAYFMPAFSNRLTDQQIADVLSFIRTAWGNSAASVTPAQVAQSRKNMPHAPAHE